MTATCKVVVIDTNVLVSGLLFRHSVPRAAVNHAFAYGQVLSSSATRNELREVIQRKKFDRCMPLGTRMNAVEDFIEDMLSIKITETLVAFRDAKDDKFLELGVNGRADFILTGDADLLAMHAFRGIAILLPADYLKLTV